MSDYSKVNLLEIENLSKNDGLKTHFARKYLDSKDLGVSLYRYEPNCRSAMAHSHQVQEEAYVVVSGSGNILLDGKLVAIKQWDTIRVAPKVSRAFESGSDGMVVIAIGGPKPPESDGVRQTPDWPDDEK